MVADDIVEMIKTTDPGDLDPDAAAKIFAHMLVHMQGILTEADIRRLIMVGAVMYRNSIRATELQMPGSSPLGTSVEPLGRLI